MITVMLPLVDYNLNAIIDEQMYNTLQDSQYSIINNEYMPYKQSKPSYHIFYDATYKEFTRTNILKSEAVDLYKNLFGKNLLKIVNSQEKVLTEKGEYMNKLFYYRIVKVDKDTYLISIAGSDYSIALIDSLRNQVIYIIYFFFFLLGTVLIVWVMSLIRPLKKIKIYIDEITNRQPSELNIDRQDEIGVVSQALVEMKEDLEKQERVKEEMIHNISHDLKTPIALIQTYGQSVKDDIYPYGDKNSSMDIILENAHRLEYKVKSLLYLNRLDYLYSENIELHDIHMKELIEKVVSQMDALNPHIHVTMDLDDCIFQGDEEHWRVAIENIIENASRYAKSKIHILLKHQILEIYNDGDHIDDDLIDFLFEPYIKDDHGQFGLGLSIVFKIVNMFGYSVCAYNRHVGVSFVIRQKR